MALFEDGDKIQKWKYKVQRLYIMIEGLPITEISGDRIRGFSVFDDYENHLFPIFRIELALESSIYYKILKHKDKVKFYLRIQKYYHYSDKDKKSLMRDYINSTFDLILDDADEDLMASLKREIKSKNFKTTKEDDTNDLHMIDNIVEFFLFNSAKIKATKKNVNHVLVNATVTDAISLICNECGINDVLMSVPNNKRSYPELFIPPLTCREALQFIDTYYGLYSKGSIIYFGFDTTYILSDTGKCTAWVKSEHTTTEIIIPASTSKHSTECGILKKEIPTKLVYVIADYKTMDIRNESVSMDVLKANDSKYVDNFDGSKQTGKSNAITKTKNTERIFENKTENKYLANTYASQMESNSTIITVRVSDFDIDTIQPNKRFLLAFEDTAMAKKYKGEYSLVSCNSTFIKEGAAFSLSAVLSFKKV